MAKKGAKGEVVLEIDFDDSGVQRGINSTEKGVNRLASSFKRVAQLAATAFSVAAIVNFGKTAVNLASDLAEVQNVVDTSFGNMSHKIEEFAKSSIEKFGLSRLSAKEMASTFMAMGTGMGQAMDIGSDKAVEMTARLADVMSFFNKSLSEVNTIGRAVYSGETEPLKQIGIVMTQSNLELFAMQKGYKQLYKNMSVADQLLVRQEYFLNATNLAAGDFVKTQDGWANQTRILTERWKEFQATMGSGLIQLLTPVVGWLNGIIARLQVMAEYFNAFISALFGSNKAIAQVSGTAEQVGEAIGGGAKAQDKLTSAVKKTATAQKGLLAGFDDIEVLTQKAADVADDMANSGGIGGTDITAPVLVEMDSTAAEAAATKLVETLKTLFAPFEKMSLDNLLNNLKSIGAALEPTFIGLWEGFFKSASEWTVDTIIDGIVFILEQFQKVADWFKVNQAMFDRFGEIIRDVTSKLWKFIEPLANSAWNSSKSIISEIVDFLLEAGKVLGEFTIKANELGMAIYNWLDSIGVIEILGTTFENIFNTIGATISFVIEIIKISFISLFEFLGYIIDLIKAVFTGDWAAAWEAVKNIFSGMIETVKKLFLALWDYLKSTLVKSGEAFIEDWGSVWQWISDFFSDIWDGIVSAFNAALDWIKSAWSSLSEWFVNAWNTMWKGVGNFFIGIWNGIVTAFENAVNWVIDGMNAIISAINSVLSIGGDFLNRFGMDVDFSIGTIPNVKFDKIPALAQGTVVPPNSRFLAMLGDNTQEHEIVSPISAMKEAVKQALSESKGGGTVQVDLILDGRALGHAIVELGDEEKRRVGTRLIFG